VIQHMGRSTWCKRRWLPSLHVDSVKPTSRRKHTLEVCCRCAAAEVSEAVKRAVAERERAMDAADAAPVMSTVQMAQLKSLIAEASTGTASPGRLHWAVLPSRATWPVDIPACLC
jgi:ribosomal protein L28